MSSLPGEIYFANIDGGRHRIIVVSRQDLNRGHYVVAVPMTSKKFEARSQLRNCTPFLVGQFGCTESCVAQGELIGITPIADLDVFGAECEPIE